LKKLRRIWETEQILSLFKESTKFKYLIYKWWKRNWKRKICELWRRKEVIWNLETLNTCEINIITI
jgi:hypothetical protein